MFSNLLSINVQLGRTRSPRRTVRVRSTAGNHKAPTRRSQLNAVESSASSARFRRVTSPLLFPVQQNYARSTERTGKVSLQANRYLSKWQIINVKLDCG